MSKYNHYALDVKNAFLTYRSAFQAAQKAVADAQSKLDEMKFFRETKIGEREIKTIERSANLKKSKLEFENVKKDSVTAFSTTVADIERRFKDELLSGSIAKHEDLDAAAVELLKSGVMHGRDYERMLEAFPNNRTMQRVIARYASDALHEAEKTSDLDNRQRLSLLVSKADSGFEKEKMKEFDGILFAAKTAAGTHRELRPEEAGMNLSSWEKMNVEQAIANF